MSGKRNRKAFTIVELVIVIAVIAILATVLVPTFGDIVGRANDSKALQAAKNAFTAYLAEHPEEASGLFLYETGNRFVTIQQGAATGVYSTREAALKALFNDPATDFDESALFAASPTAAAGLFRCTEANIPTLPEDGDPSKPYAGKVISILGDSISTFEGYIPKADGFNLEHLARYATDYEATDVTDVNETYWMQVIHALDAKLGINDSWRGAMVSGWGNNGSNSIWSITVPAQPGEQIYASSFGDGTSNGSGGTNGIRVAFLLSSGDVLQKTADKGYSEFSAKGYLEVPANAVAVSVPMWNNSGDWKAYIGDSVDQIGDSIDYIGNRLQQLPDDFTDTTNLWAYLSDKAIGERYYKGTWTTIPVNSDLHSVLIPVSEGMKISANSFGSMDNNGSNHTYDGIRITWFFAGKAPVEVLNNDV